MSRRKTFLKLALTAAFTASALTTLGAAGLAYAWPVVTGTPLSGYGPSAMEEARANDITAGVLGGCFTEDKWLYDLPTGATQAEIEKTLTDNGYKKFYDPF